jgi:GntR family transcriptional regulator
MRIQISKESEVPIREQLAAQLVFLIGTGQLKPGDMLPSVRELARRLNVHRNTVSEAYRDSTLDVLVEKAHGRRLRVRINQPSHPSARSDLDDVVDSAVLAVRKRGYTLQQLCQRLQQRLSAAPPDRVLVVSNDVGLDVLLAVELRQRFRFPVETCVPDQLKSRPERAIGALVLSTPAALPKVDSLLPVDRPAVCILFSSADEHLERIRRLQQPALIAVVSVSEYFVEMARGLLAPVVGGRHSLREYLLSGDNADSPGPADLIFCDLVTYPLLRSKCPRSLLVRHNLISPASLEEIGAIMSRAPGKPNQRPR